MPEADFSILGREVRRVVDDRGPTTWKELRTILADRGHGDLPDQLLGSDLSDVLCDEHGVRHVGNDEVVATREQATGGVVVTHRLAEAEITHGYVLTELDLTMLLYDVPMIRLTGPDGDALELLHGPRADLDLGRHDVALRGPPGWLGACRAGDVLAVRLDDRRLTFEPIDRTEPDDDLPSRLRSTLADVVIGRRHVVGRRAAHVGRPARPGGLARSPPPGERVARRLRPLHRE